MITSTLLRACKLIYCGRSITKPRIETKQQKSVPFILKENIFQFCPQGSPDVKDKYKDKYQISFSFAPRPDLMSLADITNWLSSIEVEILESHRSGSSPLPCQELRSPITWEKYKDKHKHKDKCKDKGPLAYDTHKDKDKDKDKVLKRPNICYIFEKQGVQGYQIWQYDRQPVNFMLVDQTRPDQTRPVVTTF